MKTQMLLLSLLCLVGLAACNRGEVTDIQRDPAGGVDVTAQLSETDINDAIADALAVDNPLLRDPNVDLQAGQIVVSGTTSPPMASVEAIPRPGLAAKEAAIKTPSKKLWIASPTRLSVPIVCFSR